MRSPSWFLLVLAACGRVGFDPLGETDGHSSEPPPGDVCATAVPLELGVTLANQVIDGANDDYAAGICGNGPDVVFRVTAPSSGQRFANVIAPFDVGITNSASCPPPIGSCSQIGGGQGTGTQVGMTLAAGVNYVLVDRGVGTGTTFSIRIQ